MKNSRCYTYSSLSLVAMLALQVSGLEAGQRCVIVDGSAACLSDERTVGSDRCRTPDRSSCQLVIEDDPASDVHLVEVYSVRLAAGQAPVIIDAPFRAESRPAIATGVEAIAGKGMTWSRSEQVVLSGKRGANEPITFAEYGLCVVEQDRVAVVGDCDKNELAKKSLRVPLNSGLVLASASETGQSTVLVFREAKREDIEQVGSIRVVKFRLP